MRERPLVLVVDDDENLLELVRDILVGRKIDAVTATNGFEGVELARERRPDLVVLDVMMPGLDGYKTCALLKQDADLKGIPVLMFTAGEAVKFNERAFQAGAAFCLAKPFEARPFISLVELALSRARTYVPPAEPERRRRAFPRFQARYSVTARATGGMAERQEVVGLSGNISAGGLLCTLPERFPVMTPLSLRVETPAGPVAIAGSVTWCGSSAGRRAGPIPHGLRVLQFRTPDDAARWRKLLNALEEAAQPEREGRT
ncbi:MAG: response regulator [candidate division NC10 bacterium]|nr:response regulator [candidate division NC10 bacterium]